jgi:F-type H+-transporting ATPase subunit epsilon
MTTFDFDLVSPERLVFSGKVEQVDVPGSEGEFGVLADHAPVVAMLRPGILVVHGEGAPQRIVVSGGFAEVGARGLTVLADLAVPVEQFDTARLATEIKNAEEDAADAKDEAQRDKLNHRIEQLKALQAVVAAQSQH